MKAGIYTVQQIMQALDFDFAQAEGDYRRVKIGGLGFDYLDKTINIPESAESIDITLDGEIVASQEVEPADDE